jgi:hypothetical protein
MDARVKPAHDELAKQLNLARMGLVPRIHVFGAKAKAWMAGTSPAMTTYAPDSSIQSDESDVRHGTDYL